MARRLRSAFFVTRGGVPFHAGGIGKMAENRQSFFNRGWGRYLLPGIVLQSVLIGGGYATGREIIEYGAKFGANGWISGLFIFLAFGVIAVLTFELARIYKIYDYKSIVRAIAGPLWIVYDVIYFILLFLIISVMASATGEILQQTIGLNYWIGVIALVIIAGLLNFYGSRVVEKFETFGTVILYAAYIVFTVLVIASRHTQIGQVFASHDTSYVPGAGVLAAAGWGILYASYNLAAVPAGLFTLRRQTTRREAVVSGVLGAAMMTIPWFLTYFAVMAFYPDPKVLGATVPWLTMLGAVSDSPLLVIVFGVVVGWTLIETATGMIHALLERIDKGLADAGKSYMSGFSRGGVTVIIFLLATIFAKFGIIDLIGMGYQLMSYGFILVYLIPLVTVGLYKVVKYGSATGRAAPAQPNPAAGSASR